MQLLVIDFVQINVVQASNTNANNQKWIVDCIPGTSFFVIKPAHAPSMYLSAASTPISNNTNVCLSSTIGNGAQWKITLNSGEGNNGNYIIKSNYNNSYVLTVKGAYITENTNVIMFTHSSGNACNDEWIFVSTSGDSVHSINLTVQKDKSYREEYFNSSSHSYNTYEERRVIADAGKPFYRKWHIEFRPTYSDIYYTYYDNCVYGYATECSTDYCGSVCLNRAAAPNHDKNFDFNAHFVCDHYTHPDDDLLLILTGASSTCHYGGSGHSVTALGMAWGASNYPPYMMAKETNEYVSRIRVIQHELTHTFGIRDNQCSGSKTTHPCIMNGGFDENHSYNLDDIWCSNCESNFNRLAH